MPGNTAFFQGLRERADRYGILLVIDEIQTGFGRTGKFFGHQHFDVRPDIITIAKGLASGFPLSGIAASEELMAKGWPGSQGGTYGGNAVSCAAAVATLEVIEKEDLVANAAARGGVQLLDGARTRAIDGIGDVRASDCSWAASSRPPTAARTVRKRLRRSNWPRRRGCCS